MSSQPGILGDGASQARSLSFDLRGGEPAPLLLASVQRLAAQLDPAAAVVGLGEPLLRALGKTVPGLRSFPALTGPGCAMPSTQHALWVELTGGDRGALLQRAAEVCQALGGAFELAGDLEAFKHREGRDLSGYLDGTENPKEAKAAAAALVAGVGPGLDGGSFAAVQRWLHDLAYFNALPEPVRDQVIGRRLSDDVELKDAPGNAHVKRTAQESFAPEAFMVRRSLPWIEGARKGLLFVAFVEDLDRFERVLRRMAGLEDGVTDSLLRFSRPETGAYFWCPPVHAGRLDLSAIGG